MKIAFLIAIHNLPEQANIFIRQLLTYEGSYIFVHIDKKAAGIEKELYKDERVKIVPFSYDVSWGDYTQIQYVLEMMKYASGISLFDYYSIHSGCDLLVRPMQELISYLKTDYAYAYLDCFRLPNKQWQYGGGMGRIKLYWPKFFRKRVKYNSPLRYIRSLYGRMYGLHLIPGRKINGIQYWGKSAWYTLGRECVDNMILYLEKDSSLLDVFKTSLCGDEIFFNTLAHLSHKADQNNKIVDNNNLRYIDFKNIDYKSPGAPKILEEDDIGKIKESNAFFIRKTDLNKSDGLIKYYTGITGMAGE